MRRSERVSLFSVVHTLRHANRRHTTIVFTWIGLILVIAWLYHGGSINQVVPLSRNGAEGSDMTSGPSKSELGASKSLIPRKIWQILLPNPNSENQSIDPKQLHDTASWLAMNVDYKYTLVGPHGAENFVKHYFSHKPNVVSMYRRLSNVGMKSDLLRYLLLDVEGGVYSDTDTVALKPIDEWVPTHLRDKVRLIVGVEFDRRDGGAWADIPHWLQLAQWTIAAAPGHPVFAKMVDRVLRSVTELSDMQGVSVQDLRPGSFDVMNSTGPAAWTDVVFEQLQEYDPSLKTTKDLSFMTGAKLYGDILVLNIDGFGMGQAHSHSTNNGSIPELALVKHLFRGSWRGQ